MESIHLSSETFSSVDAAWLHMEKPSNMAMITGVMIFGQPVDHQRLKKTVERRMLLNYPRFMQRVREPRLGIGLPVWETDPNFDLDWHIQRLKLPAPGDMTALQDQVGEMMSMSLDFTRPLWQYHLIEHFGDGSALIVRLHHCIADGLALIQVLLGMTDETPDAPEPELPPSPAPLSRLARVVLPAVRLVKTLDHTRKTTQGLLQDGWQWVSDPSRLTSAARLSVSGTRALAKLLLIPPDRKTLFKGRCQIPKHAAWSNPIPLEEVKAIGKLMGGTINDVLLSAVTGALRRYLEERQQNVVGLNIRAVVPVSIRPEADLDKLGNRFGLVFLSLPIGVKDPIKRMLVLKQRMNAIKDTPEAIVAFGILSAIGMTPVQVESIIVRIFGMKGTAVMTNVPGPRKPIYLAGASIDSLMFWVPQPGNLAMGVSIISYNGQVTLGIATDACLVSDPERIITNFHEELQFLKSWGRAPAATYKPAEVQVPSGPAAMNVPVQTAAEPLQVQEVTTCQALTKAGQPCKNRPLPGQTTCRVHQNTHPAH